MHDLEFKQLYNAKFELYEKNPIVKHFGLSTIVADPSVLPPDCGGNKKWQMFCHTLLGISRLESTDGINFVNKGRVAGRAMRPDINYIDGEYYLYYERVQPLLKKAASLAGGKWFSEIYLIRSKDLQHWTKPVKVIGADKPYESGERGTALSNPFLLRENGVNRLYFSAGLTFIDDCGFCEPTYISYAESSSLTEGFTSAETPIISPDENSGFINLCSGCIKVYRLKDCYIGLQNGIFKDKDGFSRSSIMLLRSEDGLNFRFEKMLLQPQMCGGSDWMNQYVYACCLVKYENWLYFYFNARDVSDMLRGRESIGLMRASLN